MKLSELIADSKNARKRDKRASATLEHSLRTGGAGRSIVIDRLGNIIAGNGVVEAAAKAGITEVEIVDSDGTKIVAVRRNDLDLGSDTKARQLALADNRTSELAEWDTDILAEISVDLDLVPYFTNEELAKVLKRPPPGTGLRQESALSYSVIVECGSEQQQTDILTELEARGLTCRLLIS